MVISYLPVNEGFQFGRRAAVNPHVGIDSLHYNNLVNLIELQIATDL